ncbi:MAG: GNAT family N-acetyltransferase [Patulibacter sp.]|nr:GNAT family N-acetyltransferase [Patulibacter sp.]
MTRPDPSVAARPVAVAPPWTVDLASPRDVAGAAQGVARLLEELGAPPSPIAPMEDAARRIVGDPSLGSLLVARTPTDDAVIGLLGSSWRTAIHRGGRYAVIEELWVDPAWRGHAVGRDLVGTLVDEVLPREEIACVEVGLPRPSFGGLEATTGFYLACGFSPIGPRMRRVLP